MKYRCANQGRKGGVDYCDANYLLESRIIAFGVALPRYCPFTGAEIKYWGGVEK